MTKPDIILIGAGGHAKSCINLLESVGTYNIFGILDLASGLDGALLGYPIIGTDKDLPHLVQKCKNAMIAIGQIKSSKIRANIYLQLKMEGFNIPTIISPNAHISKFSTIGDGVTIMGGVTVNAGVSIGNNCIINSHALVEHDVVIGNDCHISTGAILNGGVTIGGSTFIGSGAIVKQNVKIGSNCIIPMASKIESDIFI